MTADEVLAELRSMGNESTKNVLTRHSANEPFYGVKTGDLKRIQKKKKKNYEIALALYDTGISDAMYLCRIDC